MNYFAMTTPQCVIIGAGFAGAATAYHLSRRGIKNILVLEQEPVPGVHSSGRNAAMVRQVVSDPNIADLAREGAAFLRSLPAYWPVPVLFRQNGSLLLGSGEGGWGRLARDAETAREQGIEANAGPLRRQRKRSACFRTRNSKGRCGARQTESLIFTLF